MSESTYENYSFKFQIKDKINKMGVTIKIISTSSDILNQRLLFMEAISHQCTNWLQNVHYRFFYPLLWE